METNIYYLQKMNCINPIKIGIIFLAATLIGCDISQLNNPYKATSNDESILYSAFAQKPKHLDPAVAYSANEYSFIAQIYEPPYQYHYLKRPYQLVPLTAVKMPDIVYFNLQQERLEGKFTDNEIAYSDYIIEVKPGIQYQLHPAFTQQNRQLKPQQLEAINKLSDFKQQASRELIAADYVYQIKRLADPKVQSPIAEIMKHYIVGFNEFAQLAEKTDKLAIKSLPLAGVKVLSRYSYKIRIKGKYPQFKYWLAMPFFAPMPWEAEVFYQQKGLKDKNITLDWHPIGTGAYFLAENNPNRQMILAKNPLYHQDIYPLEGEAKDKEQGLLADAGKQLPLIDKVVYTLEKETIPYWNKFLQGYYDVSGISSDNFDQAIQFGGAGDVQLTEMMQKQQIQLQTSVTSSIFYLGFNMLDSVVGGESEAARKLRQAISIAIDYEEYIAIFMNGRGIVAQGLLPPGIYGQNTQVNPYVYDLVNNKHQRKSIVKAKNLMHRAGYANGINPKTGEALVLYFDTTAVNVDDRSRMNWYRKQLKKLGIRLVVRATDYNRFQEKMRNGSGQLFVWGWNADYPDSENFFFLLYGLNGKVKYGGENATNYDNIEFNLLFEQMRNMDNNPKRYQIIQKMQKIIRHDAPLIFGFHPKNFVLAHKWYKNSKPNLMANNKLKYARIDTKAREQKIEQWNKPVFWPLLVIFLLSTLFFIPAVNTYRRHATKTMQ